MKTLRSLAGAAAIAGAFVLPLPAWAQGAPPAAQGPGAADPFGNAAIPRTAALADAQKRFDQLDTNHDGALGPDEIVAASPRRAAPGAGQPSQRAIGFMVARMDANKDGKVDKTEYVARQIARFDRMDADHDGQLTAAERKAAMEAMRQRMAERMARQAVGGAGGDNSPPAGD